MTSFALFKKKKFNQYKEISVCWEKLDVVPCSMLLSGAENIPWERLALSTLSCYVFSLETI